MTRWITYVSAFGLLLAFILGMKYLSYVEQGSFGDGFALGAFLMALVMILGFKLQEREFRRQSEIDDR